MNNGMVRCQECGAWYFNRKKLNSHLIDKHGYKIKIKEEREDNEVES